MPFLVFSLTKRNPLSYTPSIMADITKNQLRATAAFLKDYVEALYTDVATIHTVSQTWTVNQNDLLLPTITGVKIQLVAYYALKIKSLSLDTSLRDILNLTDTVIPSGITFDQPLFFSGDAPIIFS